MTKKRILGSGKRKSGSHKNCTNKPFYFFHTAFTFFCMLLVPHKKVVLFFIIGTLGINSLITVWLQALLLLCSLLRLTHFKIFIFMCEVRASIVCTFSIKVVQIYVNWQNRDITLHTPRMWGNILPNSKYFH